MRFILTLSFTLLVCLVFGQVIPECPITTKVQNRVRLEVSGLHITQSISKRKLMKEGFVLRVENKAYRIRGFMVVIPCQSEWLMDMLLLKFTGNVAPPNDKGLGLLRVGDYLDITNLTLEKDGICYWTSGVHLKIID